MVMIESLACGTPVLAPCRGSAPEIVEDGRTGALCEDDDDFVDAVGRLDSFDRRACRAAAEDRFSLSRMVEDHLRLYERLGAGPCSRATG